MAEVFYVSFGDYCRIAAEVLGTTPEQIVRLPRIGLADSALAAPGAGFGDQEAYPDLIEKAAVLVEHLCQRSSRIPQGRPSNLPTHGHDFSPPAAIGSPHA